MAFKGFEPNIRVMELQKASPLCLLLFPEVIVKETLDAIRLLPLGAFSLRKRAPHSSNWPFKSNAQALPTPKTSKSPAEIPVVFHWAWTKSTQSSKGAMKTKSVKNQSRPRAPFLCMKGGRMKAKDEAPK